MAERPTPDAVFKRLARRIGRRCSSARRPASPAMLASPEPAGARGGRAAPGVVGRRGAAGRARRALQGALRRRHRRRHRLDRDAAHLPVEPARATCATAPPAGRCRATRSSCAARTAAPVPDGEPGDLYIHGPSAAMMYWGNRDQDARDLPGRLDQERRQVRAQRRRHLHLLRPQRRHAQGQRHLRRRRSRSRRRWCSTRPCSRPP